jgi:hypothetical protein
MPTIAARRLAVVVLTAAFAVAAMIAVSSATATPPPHPRTQLYHYFCPVMPYQVAAAGPYFAR